ncbi:acyl-CoA transferase [Pseudomonas capeferrum]|uniref:CoA transferase n=1 Tax=Pseudomonas capeferrum TaxID=1495066 RepID=UPI0015E37D1D|nr:CoA transferase [Pseudomonas capeferrum]MBA1201755.1 acyl-CoA transferase [Pseudomonas capeferrum]
MQQLLSDIAKDLPVDPAAVRWHGIGALPSAFAVTELASASLAAAGLAMADLLKGQTQQCPLVQVDRRLASFWFGTSLRPQGWQVPPTWDALAGDYPTRDGWIRLHTNAPLHRKAVERVLGRANAWEDMARQVAQWSSNDLEDAVVAAGGCAATLQSWPQWCAHPQGQAVNGEPLILRETFVAEKRPWTGCQARPLAGVKVLDLTRILAGPVASRLLAGFGADVLRIDPPGWEEPAAVPEVTLGKRCARLDLRLPDDRRLFDTLLGDADILLHGYRADALERLGYGPLQRRLLNPALIDVCLNAYGWSGPWKDRRGFDSLVQMSTGIAREGMRWQQAERPVPLPVQALDHATGYLMAAEAIRALAERLEQGHGTRARLSLARTAKLLIERGTVGDDLPLASETVADLDTKVEQTPWGPARRIQSPLKVGEAGLQWARAARALGTDLPSW